MQQYFFERRQPPILLIQLFFLNIHIRQRFCIRKDFLIASHTILCRPVHFIVRSVMWGSALHRNARKSASTWECPQGCPRGDGRYHLSGTTAVTPALSFSRGFPETSRGKAIGEVEWYIVSPPFPARVWILGGWRLIGVKDGAERGAHGTMARGGEGEGG